MKSRYIPAHFCPQWPTSFETAATRTSLAVDVIGSTVRHDDVTPVSALAAHALRLNAATMQLLADIVFC